MKKTFFKSLAGIAAVAFAVSCTAPAPKYKMVIVDAPFAMEPIKECVFPEQDFSIVDYGAVKGGETVKDSRQRWTAVLPHHYRCRSAAWPQPW